MTTPETAEAMKAVAEATAGPDRPEAATVVAGPERSPVWALILAGPAVSLMIIAGVAAAVFLYWPGVLRLAETHDLAFGVLEKIVVGTFSIVTVLAVILGVVVFRLASGGLKRVEARAGPAGITVETGE